MVWIRLPHTCLQLKNCAGIFFSAICYLCLKHCQHIHSFIYPLAASSEYTATTMTVSFMSGQGVGTEVTIDIPIADDDILEEKLKSFFGSLVLQPTPLNVIVEPSRTEVTIVDDDSEGRSTLFLPSLLILSVPPSFLLQQSSSFSLVLSFSASVLFAAYL